MRARRSCQVNTWVTLRTFPSADLRSSPIFGNAWPSGMSIFDRSSNTTMLSLVEIAGRSVQLMRSPTSWVTAWVRVAPMWQVVQDGAAV